MGMMSSSDGLHSMLLSTQQILVCFLLLPKQLCQKSSRGSGALRAPAWSLRKLKCEPFAYRTAYTLYMAMHIQWG